MACFAYSMSLLLLHSGWSCLFQMWVLGVLRVAMWALWVWSLLILKLCPPSLNLFGFWGLLRVAMWALWVWSLLILKLCPPSLNLFGFWGLLRVVMWTIGCYCGSHLSCIPLPSFFVLWGGCVSHRGWSAGLLECHPSASEKKVGVWPIEVHQRAHWTVIPQPCWIILCICALVCAATSCLQR